MVYVALNWHVWYRLSHFFQKMPPNDKVCLLKWYFISWGPLTVLRQESLFPLFF